MGWLAAASAMSSMGCSDEPVERVPHDTATVAAAVRCMPRDEASLLGVSPGGELWLATPAGTRILDLAGDDRAISSSFADATRVQPWDDGSASLLAGDTLWSWRGGVREAVALPEDVGAIRAWCGDPAAPHGAFVASDRGIFERDGAWWWQWSAGGSALPAANRLLTIDGACRGRDGAVWFASDEVELWTLTDERTSPSTDAGDLRALVGDADGPAALFAGSLRRGPDWRGVEFDAGDVVAVASTYRRLWAAAGDGVFVRSDDTWARVEGLPSAAPGAIAAHAAGGAWLVYDAELCHAALEAPVVIHGVHPLERRLERTVDLELAFPGAPAGDVAIERDGEPVAMTAVSDGAAVGPELSLGGAGWHTLEVRTSDTARELDYYIEPGAARSWAADIAPIFQSYCAGGGCHGPAPSGSRPDLSTYEGWKSRASRIRTRLLAGTMPPVDPRPTPAELDVILEWIEGGTPP
jgi:hypothetical protein